MFAQVDREGNHYLLPQEIMDHKIDNSAIPISDGKISSANGQSKPKITTKGWFLLVEWRNQFTSWEKLKDLKAPNPVEVAEYAVVYSGCRTLSVAGIGLSPKLSHAIGRQHTSLEFVYQRQLKKPKD
jgi:hypothetical protein